MFSTKEEALRAIPPVHGMLEHPRVKAYMAAYGHAAALAAVRQALADLRLEFSTGHESLHVDEDTPEALRDFVADAAGVLLLERGRKTLRRVINATGVPLHTNLGRAPLPQAVAAQVAEVASGYSNLEYDLESGLRGSRQSHVESMLSKASGAESALMVNNNAAAVFLCLNTLAQDRGVVVSRGEQVEIGGSFRIPEIIGRSGARMREVGTTNKTRIGDYRAAIDMDAAILLKVHTSNYKITGFVEEVPLEALVSLAEEMRGAGLPDLCVVEDLGSGSLLDLSDRGLPWEPTVQACIAKGADLVTFSGDKLLGGPQAGIIAGKKALVDRIRKNPLARMVRCDKMSIAAMSAVMEMYRSMDRDSLIEALPVTAMLAAPVESLEHKAGKLAELINEILSGIPCTVEVVSEPDEAGGGSLPGTLLEGRAVAIRPCGRSAAEIREKLREAAVPIIARIARDRILLSVRTIGEADFALIAEALAAILAESGQDTGDRSCR